MSYTYVMSPDKLDKLLKQISNIGTPERVDVKRLKSLGYTSSNDTRMLGTLKAIGLIDATGRPTQLWKDARANLGSALGKAVRLGYSELFSTYPNAHQKDDEALRTFFSAHTDFSGDTIGKVVSTFKTLCRLADFDSDEAQEVEEITEAPARASRKAGTGEAQERSTRVSASTAVNINIQLQLPPDATGEMYDKFFEAMKKHLPLG